MARISRLLVALLFVSVSADAQMKTVEERVGEFGEIVRARLEPAFRAADVPYPPSRLALLGFKQERMLEVYAASEDGSFHFIRSYPILAASGKRGPKIREGDEQVPEGIYRVRELNPNSRFHLSLWLNYPNSIDRLRAVIEQRSRLGGEIMIHGDAVSKGCLAMGDQAAEDLFVLAALIGIKNVTVILAPIDFRKGATTSLPNESSFFLARLYRQLECALKKYSPPSCFPISVSSPRFGE